MFDLVCLGEPLIEFNQQADGRYLAGFGGDTSNCAIAAARQGAQVAYITNIGDDSFGRDYLDVWAQEKIDTQGVSIRQDAPTGIYFVTHGENGHEFTYRRNGSASSLLTPEALPEKLLKQTKFLHVSGISQGISDSASQSVLQAMRTVKQAGGQVSYDTNLRLQLWPLEKAKSVIHEAMALCDIALPGADDAISLTGLNDPDAIVDFYLALGANTVALTLGSEGTLVATPSKRERLSVRALEAKDATGAGDTFDGAFLARLACGDDPFEAATYANAAAGLSTQGYGAIAPMPYKQDVLNYLQQA